VSGSRVGWDLAVMCGDHGLWVGDCVSCRSNGPNFLQQIR
jgi:hypothetical protein